MYSLVIRIVSLQLTMVGVISTPIIHRFPEDAVSQHMKETEEAMRVTKTLASGNSRTALWISAIFRQNHGFAYFN